MPGCKDFYFVNSVHQSSTLLLICFQLSLTINPDQYTIVVDCSEPTEDGPNHGAFQDVVEGLGPITVQFDANQMWPFYGKAQLPLKLTFESSHQFPMANPSPAYPESRGITYAAD